ncbi:glycoside hydrolase family 3 N-terminal domain-containing protein [Paenibacillus solani]|uniref:glycoside hydrolase family 3 N-terminal domain-containing protein n=1 Tax=Paenibacillus solani TaxID=1705565 RepID=UPI003D2C9DE0
MIELNMEDVMNVINLALPYLIFFGAFLLVALIVIVLVRKLVKPKRFMVRAQAGIAIFLVFIIAANLTAFGPLSTLLTLATGKGKISEASGSHAKAVGEKIAAEGIVLLDNEDNFLPLESKTKINVFGWASTNPIYGGTGSGAMSDAYPTVSLLDGLTKAGFDLNNELSEFYTAYRAERPASGIFEQNWTLPEPAVSSYPTEMVEGAKNFSDTAMLVIGRSGGEGGDLPQDLKTVTYENNSEEYPDFGEGQHYLQLNRYEQELLDLVTSNFDNVIVVYSGANAFELGFTEQYEQIKSVVWVPGTGQTGFDSFGKIISGEINPSGKTADTFVYDLSKTPYFNNIGNFDYKNMDEFKVNVFNSDVTPTFVNYVENIYVGYRFYETAHEEGLIDYENTVLYPFGHGLSYTTFKQEMGQLHTDEAGNISVDVKVTNTGSVAGKEVVELYYTPPYTNGGIEKASVNLVAFDKSNTLEPGDSQTLTLTFKAEDMASYDSYNAGSWVLEDGDYNITLRSDSHTVIAEQTYHVDQTITYGENSKRSTDKVAAVNQFAFAEGDITYLSRENGFANYKEAVAAPTSFDMSAEAKAVFRNKVNYDPSDFNNPDDVMPVTDAKNGLKLEQMRGLSYDDEAWEPLLDQLSISDMVNLIGFGGYQTAEAKSVGKLSTIDVDGPASLNNNFTRVGSIGFPSAVTMANTWNEELAKEFGQSIGEMAVEMGVSGWYAPAMNMHRSALAGRNFEYYSEDGFLSGKISANAIVGAKEYGVYAYIKHFALNDQENNRLKMLATWSTEQAIREIYLKPFEIAVKEGGAGAVMSAFNYIGPEWTGSSDALLNKVLRGEWGFRGMVITDYFGGNGYMDTDRTIRNGGDMALIAYEGDGNVLDDTESATAVTAMRQATKNILYTVVNSRAYSEDALKQGMHVWQIGAIIINIVAAFIILLLEVVVFKKFRKKVMQWKEEKAIQAQEFES